jgi:hypothetical protein
MPCFGSHGAKTISLTEKICQCCFHFNSPGKWPVWAFAITWCLSSVCFFTFHTSNFFLRNTEQETKLAVMFPMNFRTRILSLVLIRHKHWHHRTLKFLIGQSFKNVFSRTEEGIGMKLGTFVPINVVSKCWDLSVDTKFKMATIGGERLHIIFMRNTFSPSSFWEPLYILLRTTLHTSPELNRDDKWCTFDDKLLRDIAAMAD